MVYLVTFLEGLITFISPCLLPMLPIYLSYFAGGKPDASRGRVLKNALGFVLGFTLLFVAMGAFAGSIGALLTRHQQAVNIISGLIVIFFGLNFLGVFRLSLFRGSKGYSVGREMGFFSAVVFGAVFAVGWTPCVGAFLGSALVLASQQGSTLRGILLLDQAPLFRDQCRLRRVAHCGRHSYGYRHHGHTALPPCLRRYVYYG